MNIQRFAIAPLVAACAVVAASGCGGTNVPAALPTTSATTMPTASSTPTPAPTPTPTPAPGSPGSAGHPSLSASAYAFGHVGQQQTFSASEVGYSGAWTLVSGNAAVASAVVSGATLTVTAAGFGSTTIGVKDAQGNAASVAITVSVSSGGVTTHAFNVTEYPTTGYFPIGIASGADGNLWITGWSGGATDAVLRATTSGSVTAFAIPTANSHPLGIVAGPDGNLWFVEHGASKIGKISTAGTITEYANTFSGENLHNIVVGSDGNMWYDETGITSPDSIGRITPSGSISQVTLSTQGAVDNNSTEYLSSLSVGPDSMLWYISSFNDQFARVTTAGFSQGFYSNPQAPAHMSSFALGADGNMWFTDLVDGVLGKITPDGSTITTYTIPSASSGPNTMVLGPDGNIWFFEQNTKNIARVTPNGTITEFPTPVCANCNVSSMVVGPDGNIWFVDRNGFIGKVQL